MSKHSKGQFNNNLEIVAITICILYGFISFSTAFSTNFTDIERSLLVYFLIFFPIFSIAILSWLIVKDNDQPYVQNSKVKKTEIKKTTQNWKSQILWVDDIPDNNIRERQAFEKLGFNITLALTTDQAMNQLSENKYAVIISDMGRAEGPREGYVLLEKVRALGLDTPFFIYAGSNAPHHVKEAISRGAQGSTNDMKELLEMINQSILSFSRK